MENITLQLFVDNYTSDDFDKIKFAWNGEHGDKFVDTNYKFRIELCEFLTPKLDTIKLELLRDLYIELSKCAKEVWGVYKKYPLFAQQLLNRGGSDYIMDYLIGASQCFDTAIASGAISLTKDKKQDILNFILNKIDTEKSKKK